MYGGRTDIQSGLDNRLRADDDLMPFFCEKGVELRSREPFYIHNAATCYGRYGAGRHDKVPESRDAPHVYHVVKGSRPHYSRQVLI